MVNTLPVTPPTVPSPPAPPMPPPVPTVPSESVSPRNTKIKPILAGLAILVLLAGLALLSFSLWQKRKIGGGPVTLTYWGLFEPAAVLQQVIADYEKVNPKVKIKYSQEDLRDYRERLQAALGRGEGPDIFRIHQSWVPMLGSYLSLLPSVVYEPTAFAKDFYPSAKETLQFHGSLVAIPLMTDGLALFYNEDLFRAIGASPPKTWDELRQAALNLTVRDEQGKIRTAGVALGTTANVDHWSDILALMMLQNGVNLADPTSPLAADALSYFTLFTKVDRVWDQFLPSSTYSFATGSLAMYFGPSWRVFDIKAINPSLNFKIIPVPQLPGTNITWASYWAEAVSKNSTNQGEAWKFLKYLSSKEVLERVYQTESNQRLFGEPYPRQDMADLLKTQPYVGAFIEQALSAKNWYLSSNTQDNGLNQQMIKYYEDAVNAVNQGQDSAASLATTAQGVAQVLIKYGLIK